MLIPLLSLALSAFAGDIVHLETRDAVALVADDYPSAQKGPAVVLLHMIPPHHDRKSWPVDFIESLSAAGYAVIVPDRRGSGDSKGTPEDAYKGEKGRYDVEAVVKHLKIAGFTKLVVIGASNGTTSALDYAAWAPANDLPPVDALGFMTGGGYTESQNSLDKVARIPAIFTFSTKERDWSVAQKAVNGDWTYKEYKGGAHGTKMFGPKPEVASDILAFLKAELDG